LRQWLIADFWKSIKSTIIHYNFMQKNLDYIKITFLRPSQLMSDNVLSFTMSKGNAFDSSAHISVSEKQTRVSAGLPISLMTSPIVFDASNVRGAAPSEVIAMNVAFGVEPVILAMPIAKRFAKKISTPRGIESNHHQFFDMIEE